MIQNHFKYCVAKKKSQVMLSSILVTFVKIFVIFVEDLISTFGRYSDLSAVFSVFMLIKNYLWENIVGSNARKTENSPLSPRHIESSFHWGGGGRGVMKKSMANWDNRFIYAQ